MESSIFLGAAPSKFVLLKSAKIWRTGTNGTDVSEDVMTITPLLVTFFPCKGPIVPDRNNCHCW